MGGRIASQVLGAATPSSTSSSSWDSPNIAGLVLLGYPLHPPGQPDKLRTAHLPTLRTPTLVVQGSRDEFGSELHWKYRAVGDFRTFVAPLPLKREDTPGYVLPTGQGWFSMSKL